MGRLAWCTLLGACAACGSPSIQPGDAGSSDASALVEGPNVVTVRLYAPVDYIRYRNGTSGWGEPERVSDVEYRLHVDDAYEVIIACEDEYMGYRASDSELHARALADGDDSFLGCVPVSSPPPPPPENVVTVSGEMQQPGEVVFGDFAASKTGPWSFVLGVEPGIHDLIAIAATRRIAIRRDIVVTAATTLAPIDLEQEGSALDEVDFGLIGRTDGEVVRSSTLFMTEHEYAFFDGTDVRLALVPASLLGAGDLQTISIETSIAQARRGVSGPATGGQTLFPLMPLLANNALTFSLPDNRTLRGELTAVPACDELELAIYADLQSQRTAVTKAFFTATQRSYIALDTPLDFDARWRVNLRSEYTRFLYARRTASGYTYETSRVDTVTNVLGN